VQVVASCDEYKLKSDEQENLDDIIYNPKDKDYVLATRYKEKVLLVRPDTNHILILKWKTFKKNQRKGKELDANWFDHKEKQAFVSDDAKEWQSFIDTGAVEIILPILLRRSLSIGSLRCLSGMFVLTKTRLMLL
jgi:hypothetical protein